MSESLIIIKGTKEQQYQNILAQIRGLLDGETDMIANMANITSALNMQFHWWWTGFYIIKNDELVLGPFQGPVACTRIRKGRGVCGTAWQQNKTLVIDDVNQFPGHIACSADSRSEIVIPVIKNAEVIGVLDIDSEHYGYFDQTDKKYLEEIVSLL